MGFTLITINTRTKHRGSLKDNDIVQITKIIYPAVNMPSIILVFFIEFVSLIWCVHLDVPELNCFDDYVTTMICDFTFDKLLNCSGYSLDFESPIQEHYRCTLINSEEYANSYRSKCGCTVEMPEFVNNEKYTVRLMEGRKVVNSTIITATNNIKPKAPEILLVMLMENGNYNVTWNTNYPEDNALSDFLEIQLSYNKKGEPDKTSRIVSASLPFHEIPGSDLEPSCEYVVKARSYSSRYKTRFSDWSRAVEWTHPASVGNVSKAIIPVLCVLLIINICAFYWCCTRLKEKWWDKIPTPNNDIKDMLPVNAEVFILKNDDPSSYHPALLTVVGTEEKSWTKVDQWISECEQDAEYKNVSSRVSAKDSGVYSCGGSQKRLSGSVGSCGSSESGYKNVLYTRQSTSPLHSTSSHELLSGSSGPPSFPTQPTPRSDSDSCHVYSEVQFQKTPGPGPPTTLRSPDLFTKAPRIATDFEYRVTGAPPVERAGPKCPFSVDGPDAALLLKTCANAIRVDDGYESFGEAIARAVPGRATFPACTLGPCEEGYQALETVVKNRADWHSDAGEADREASSIEGPEKSTGQNWELSQDFITSASPLMQKSSVESSSNSALTASPIIQIYTDSSYHSV
ncbi:hypothetical protein SKAU_G00290690 [Synaphobranchus kaupii]|uniref:Fibronectin type-III domain-containing protein n=1 Tax=Synaphobranchus kaupii TaxID=118154 RepID=A0A9Q1IMC4_SYNKA|nr:hypothetical protein SKAU_G00290690 [Synaphobranchus kaupii]